MSLHIAEPFWGAWKVYGWEKPIPGIGINLKTVEIAQRENTKIQVTIGKDPALYEISPVTIMNLAEKYQSIRPVRSGVKVVVIPQNRLTRLTPVELNLPKGQTPLFDEV